MKPLAVRTLCAFCFGPFLLIGAWLGGIYLQILISIISVLSIIEFYKLVKQKKKIQLNFTFLIITALLINWYVFFIGLNNIIFIYILIFTLTLIFDVVRDYTSQSSERVAYTIFALLYIPLLLEFMFLIRKLENGNLLLILLMILVWITDTAAYFVGAKFGKHRNIFKASEKKSLEGFLTGILSAFVFAYLLNIIINAIWKFYLLTDWKDIVAYGIIVGIIGQLGDLIESNLKRDFQVKNTSKLLPGHGGILDRFDSLMISAPFLYFYFIFIR
ncbi:MAG: phosphatidate cytidylyltransferase [Candidatus Cloacimonetes bacterium]|nr:phosphatidate cytidylyltransferase [Candidatus Cloacimonadota bacterium]MBL7085479.1 phosphatidate cytidylyltransferase [Candidatus Cloacimonadota bacterium]